MKKVLATISVGLAILLSWFFYTKPEPPFGADPIIVSNEPTYFAEIDENGIVLRVIVISQENLNTGKWGDPSRWVETTLDGRIRKNYAGIGDKYDASLNAFIDPKPFDSWTLDEATAKWKAPKIVPKDGTYDWDEKNLKWIKK